MRYPIADEGHGPAALRCFPCQTGATPGIRDDAAALPDTA
jgi:hypothetical protein